MTVPGVDLFKETSNAVGYAKQISRQDPFILTSEQVSGDRPPASG
jgi:hypothetical protein